MVKRLASKDLKPGMFALEAIVTQHGQEIAPAGVKLSRQIINKSKLYNIQSVLVNVADEVVDQVPVVEEIAKPVEMPIPVMAPIPVVMPATPVTPPPAAPVINTEEVPEAEKPVILSETELLKNTRIAELKPKSQTMVRSKEFMEFQVDYLLAKDALCDAFANLTKNKEYHIDERDLVKKISTLYASRKTITELFDMIYQMRSIEDSIYSHSVNVALISRMIGRWLYLDASDLDVLTCCGLLHDIGKLAIPESILNKPSKLTDEEFELIKSHPKIGYDMLRNQNIDNRIKQSALMHHERYDGSGYPSGLSSELLVDFAMIVAIADVYDAMTATRSYREPLCPFQVIANFEQEGLQKYHTKYLLVFLDRIASTYQNNRVLLNDGRACKIVMLNPNNLSKPIIQLDDGSCIDLASRRDLYISKVL